MKKILKSESYRNYLLFVLGINFGLRISDLLNLRWGDVLNERGKVKEAITIKEKKTCKTKRFALNKSCQEALVDYLKDNPNIDLDYYLFQSRKGENKAIGRMQAWQVINDAAKEVGIEDPIGTHTLRKTLGYHAFKNGTSLVLLQKVLNHSSPGITLRYIGVTQEDIANVYINLNL